MASPRACLALLVVVVAACRADGPPAQEQPSTGGVAETTAPPRSAVVDDSARKPCEATEQAAAGDTFERIARRCYGSRTYQDWLVTFNHHQRRALRAGEKIDLPSFGTLAGTCLRDRWKSELPGIQRAYESFVVAQPEIEAAFRKQSGGFGAYHPSATAQKALLDAVAALEPVVTRLASAGVRNRQFATALDQLRALAAGTGSFSLDYETETIHQHFKLGVDALC